MDLMPFGKHKGQPYSSIPTPYLEWGVVALKGGVKRQMEDELSRRNGIEPVRSEPEIIGRHDASSQFDPNSDWPGRQDWDGASPPWEEQFGRDSLFSEFRSIIL